MLINSAAPFSFVDILERIKHGGIKPTRPTLNENEHCTEIVQLAHLCWNELPSDRPTFHTVRKVVKNIRMTRCAAIFTCVLIRILS
ncbi:hypothetical protein DPMN_011276 [Dreissena polymorpha]|uniref:Serine-threonine/tyrosine-protein kinase catalytic domain-containing protein n=1 Tax=Dreissena polymorpha TaxID=45954 RepID=A0A9D4N3R4_DREPO|nr:hypothetical protein DPMN_011276 [Dreissena polymorpha]